MDKSLINPYVGRIHDLPQYILARSGTFDEADGKLLTERAAAYQDMVIELGSGSGKHIILRAAESPTALFIGFELRFKRVFRTAEKAKQQGVNNLLLLKTKAEESLTIFAENSLQGIFCNFPDPWEKKHWQKHRMLRQEILFPLLGKLKPGGFFAFKTDHRGYFEYVTELLKSNESVTVEFVTDDLHKSPANSTNIETEFECLFRSKGLPTYFIRATKKG